MIEENFRSKNIGIKLQNTETLHYLEGSKLVIGLHSLKLLVILIRINMKNGECLIFVNFNT